jgi:hypothetical protein
MAKPAYSFGHAAVSNVPVKTEPDKYGDVKYLLHLDETVIIDPNGGTEDYYLVTVNGITGYVPKALIK